MEKIAMGVCVDLRALLHSLNLSIICSANSLLTAVMHVLQKVSWLDTAANFTTGNNSNTCKQDHTFYLALTTCSTTLQNCRDIVNKHSVCVPQTHIYFVLLVLVLS